ncbi:MULTISPECIES: TniB family NTP-binding protein [Aeromicrobium]|uniref:TniB family NTP-binding protein n=1 Tax=Aeromicrobium TaxID=2040 RepID=UPI00257AD528|nr:MULTISPECIES: TniB family NTP-binding protein [Aeromicrobium]
MDAHQWHLQATAHNGGLPAPVEDLAALDDDARTDYLDTLHAACDALVLRSTQMTAATRAMSSLVNRAGRRPRGAQRIIAVNAPFTTGKSTFVKDWASELHRDWLGGSVTHDRPTWQPEPHMTADLVPVIYVTLRAASAIKEVNAQILSFLRYPSEGVTRATTTRVQEALFRHGVRLVIIDDVHMLRVNHTQGRDVLDYLKYLNSELGELGGTLVLVGALLSSGPIYGDPQIRGRLQAIELRPHEIATPDGRREWQKLLKAAEQLLLPYAPSNEPGVFAREHAAYIWRRSQGYLGDTATLLTGAVLGALSEEQPVTRDHLASVLLSLRAHENEADLTSASGQGRGGYGS